MPEETPAQGPSFPSGHFGVWRAEQGVPDRVRMAAGAEPLVDGDRDTVGGEREVAPSGLALLHHVGRATFLPIAVLVIHQHDRARGDHRVGYQGRVRVAHGGAQANDAVPRSVGMPLHGERVGRDGWPAVHLGEARPRRLHRRRWRCLRCRGSAWRRWLGAGDDDRDQGERERAPSPSDARFRVRGCAVQARMVPRDRWRPAVIPLSRA